LKDGQEITAPTGARFRLKDISPKKYELELTDAKLEDGAAYKVEIIMNVKGNPKIFRLFCPIVLVNANLKQI